MSSTEKRTDEAKQIRATHPYAFRSGMWATLEGITDHAGGHRCYVVRFPDGMSDFWPVDDEAHGYEFWPVGAVGGAPE